MRGCFFFIFFFASSTIYAQTKGRLEVIKDPRIDTLAARRLNPHAAAGHAISNGATTGYGYRVQIFTGPSRKDAFNAQTKFQQQYPDLRTYIIYREPNFKVRAGDFRSRMEAEKMTQDLRHLFSGMFIISEKINLPKPDITSKRDSTNE